jgi:hypothetical protein
MIKDVCISVDHCLVPAGQILFALPKKYPKTLVQKKAIAKHRSFSNQNAFSIADGEQCLRFYHKCDRRTFDSSFTITVF